ncbi:hypothetical protein ACJMK2_004597 [Sinanodonta woodiana]|uniref:Uncharacterized protein n=1 Tax=Sinanodonta woodiana TaxID=1069815 RepID=A0ABD3Y3H7_SINWO
MKSDCLMSAIAMTNAHCIQSEICNDVSDCRYETCHDAGWFLTCSHMICTCSQHASLICTHDSECIQSQLLGPCPNGLRWYCRESDGTCHCRRN